MIVATTHLDAASESYVAEIIDLIEAYGSVSVSGAFVLGSGLLGGFDPRTSDIDLVVVVARPLNAFEKAAIRQSVGELPVPARKLELVVYAAGAKPPAYELNFPDGDDESACWFVIDAAVGQEHAVPFSGMHWSDLFQPGTEEEVRQAVSASLAWAEQNEPDDPNTATNAARARRYLEDGIWISKAQARKEAGP